MKRSDNLIETKSGDVMDAEKVFYTSEQKDVLSKVSKSERAKITPVSEATGALILDALGEQQNTLQNIESILQRIKDSISPDK